jgi:hypothetical protein
MGVWSYVFGVDAESQRRADIATADAKNRAFANYTSGKWTLEQYREAMQRLDANANEALLNDAAIAQDFQSGAMEGLQSATNFIQGATDGIIVSTWKLIPWQVKVGAGILLALWAWSNWKAITK